MIAPAIARAIGKLLVPVSLMAVLGVLVFAPRRALSAEASAEKDTPKSKREEAARLLARFDRLRDQYQREHRRTWANSCGAALVGSAALAGGFPNAGVQLGLRLRLMHSNETSYLLYQDDGPPDVLLAAVRAARAALRDDPKDAQAHLLLGEVYYRLAFRTSERAWRPQFTLLDRMRRMQMAAAWNQAIRLRPNTVQAHAQLALLYRDMGYADLMRIHFRRVLECTRAAGPAKEDRDRFDRRVQGLKDNLGQLEKEVEKRLEKFAAASSERPILEQAAMALRLGLPGKALDMLLASDITKIGRAGARMELELLLVRGRVKEVGEWLTPQLGEALGPTTYHVLGLHWAAATGDYAVADKFLQKLSAQMNPPAGKDGKAGSPRSHLALLAGRMLLEGHRQRESPAQLVLVPLNRGQYRKHSLALLGLLREQSDLLVLRGLLAQEAGRDREAARCFRDALDVWQSDAAVASGSGLDFNGRVLAQRGLRLVDKTKEKAPAEKK